MELPQYHLGDDAVMKENLGRESPCPAWTRRRLVAAVETCFWSFRRSEIRLLRFRIFDTHRNKYKSLQWRKTLLLAEEGTIPKGASTLRGNNAVEDPATGRRTSRPYIFPCKPLAVWIFTRNPERIAAAANNDGEMSKNRKSDSDGCCLKPAKWKG